jgi:hypothetical protein
MIIFSLVQQPKSGQDHLLLEISRWHTMISTFGLTSLDGDQHVAEISTS